MEFGAYNGNRDETTPRLGSAVMELTLGATYLGEDRCRFRVWTILRRMKAGLFMSPI